MNFDLDIENYSKDELIQMFELPPNFDRNIVEIKETKLKDSINNNRDIDKETRVKTVNFLNKAKNIILDEKKNFNNDFNIDSNNKFDDILSNVYHSSEIKLKKSKLEDKAEHMIQVRPPRPYLESDPGTYFPGSTNPIKKKTLIRMLNIDTRFRDNYFSSPSTNFNLILPTQFNDVLEMNLTGIELPTSYNVVSKQYGNNFFTITVSTATKTETALISIPDGNYDDSSIVTAINYQLSLAPSPISNVQFAINATSGSGGTGSYQTMVGPGPNSLHGITNIELNFQANNSGYYDDGTPLPLKFGWLLGFRNGIYNGNVNYVSEGIADLNGPKYLFLVVDDFNNNVNNYFYSAFNSSILNNNILARLSLVGNISTLQQNNKYIAAAPREYFGPVNITNFNIQLLDEYGRIVDLNNMDFSFCLSLTVVHNI
jgi:hypothetical protein